MRINSLFFIMVFQALRSQKKSQMKRTARKKISDLEGIKSRPTTWYCDPETTLWGRGIAREDLGRKRSQSQLLCHFSVNKRDSIKEVFVSISYFFVTEKIQKTTLF